MQARGPLMIEHRLIEKMIGLIEKKLARAEDTGKIDPRFIDTAVDFIQTYADRTHHGKEEDIMFRELDGRDLSSEDRGIMKDLIEEHVFARKTTQALKKANELYRGGREEELPEIRKHLKTLVDFYPGHIEKEDKVFFPAARNYMSDAEDQEMLTEFQEFDQQMIHEKYKSVVAELDGS